MNIVAVITAIAMIGFGFAGGGGSSSGGGGGGGGGGSYSSHGSSDGDGELTPLDAVFIGLFVIIVIVTMIKSSKKAPKFHDNNNTATEMRLHEEAKQIFEKYQADWSSFNYENIKQYTTSHYYQHASLMLDLLRDMHRVNKVSSLKVRKVYLLDPVPEEITLPRKIRVAYLFDGLDEVEDTVTNRNLYRAFANKITETWNYIYDGKSLKLDGISQPTESASHLVKSLAVFANQNNLFYSPDWGRYALPSRGLIFGGATMREADINNHVIGRWVPKSANGSAHQNSAASVSEEILVQLYTYAERPDQATSSYYIVGQINVPKNYLGVIVKSKRFKTGHRPDKTYEKFELEWNKFNDRYDVYAASRDALPAFELLNPKFMEYLYNTNPSYNLEVVDNVIYIYASIKNVSAEDYQELLEVLKKAYDELKM